jgi:hypothetical protein
MVAGIDFPVPEISRGARTQRVRRIVRTGIAALLAVLTLLLVPQSWAESGLGTSAAVASDCETPFVVATDATSPGERSQSGDVAVTRGSGLVGEFGGSGRFADYAIAGSMEIIQNTASGMARVQGEFTAISPDGASSITLSYNGQVNFGAARATGNFVVVDATGADAGYRASGTIEGTVVAPGTLQGIDVGLC